MTKRQCSLYTSIFFCWSPHSSEHLANEVGGIDEIDFRMIPELEVLKKLDKSRNFGKRQVAKSQDTIDGMDELDGINEVGGMDEIDFIMIPELEVLKKLDKFRKFVKKQVAKSQGTIK